MRGEPLQLTTGGGIPEPHHLVGRARGDELAISRGGRRQNGSAMPAQRGHELAVADVPEPSRPIRGTGGKLRAVATGLDRQDRVGMAGKLTNYPGLMHVPEPHRFVCGT